MNTSYVDHAVCHPTTRNSRLSLASSQAWLSHALLWLSLCCAGQALAADFYRCGNVYQDRPCANASQAKVISSKSSAAAEPRAGARQVDADCMKKGEASKKVVWLRESGKTEEDQLSTAKDGYTRRLVGEVYQRRGSAIEVKKAIEDECMAQKEKDRLAAALYIEAQRLNAGGAPSAAVAAPPSTTPSTNKGGQVTTVGK